MRIRRRGWRRGRFTPVFLLAGFTNPRGHAVGRIVLAIELLQALLDQQKRQNALLRRLCEANAPEKEDVAEPTVAGKAKGEDEFIRLVAER